ncbi:MAG TPA: SPOR domain-containing protein [bacterium]|nr:SPOR domain-containing protein [bacterium]
MSQGDRPALTPDRIRADGEHDRAAVAMKGGRLSLALVGLGVVGIFAVAVAAGYFMGQTSFRTPPPPPALTLPTVPGSASTTAPGSGTPPAVGPAPLPAEPAPSPQPQPTAPPGPPAPAEAPPAPQAPPPPPSSPVPGPTGLPSVTPAIPEPPSRFHVQVGSFDDRTNAEALVTQLRARGYAVTLVEGPPYRVWVGGYLDRGTAERLAANLQAAGFDVTLSAR